ncbi:MAG TPA: hypothetical protein VFZ61_31420, partial [Polyangiales bacterium]
DAALARYTRDHRFRHPTPDDLATAFDQAYGRAFGQRVLRPLLFEGEVSGVRLLRVSSKRAGERHRTQVHARRDGRVALPCWVALYDLDGKELTRIPWREDVSVLQVDVDTTAPVARVVADPDRALLLDADARDQVWVLQAPPTHGWLAQATALAQLVLAWVGP